MKKLTATIAAIPAPDSSAREEAELRQSQLTKPTGSLGHLENLAIRVAGMTGAPRPRLKDKVVLTVAGDHGIVAAGVSAYPQEVTAQMVLNFLHDGAAINVLARHAGARVVVVDAGVATPLPAHDRLRDRKIGAGTANMLEGPAMSQEQAVKAIETGIELVEEELQRGLDILCTGDMGIGNTTPSTAITSVLTGRSVTEIAGRGTGLDDAGLVRKIETIDKVLEVNHPDPTDALDVLAKVGWIRDRRNCRPDPGWRGASHPGRRRRLHFHRRRIDCLYTGSPGTRLLPGRPSFRRSRPRYHAGAPWTHAHPGSQHATRRRHRRCTGRGHRRCRLQGAG